MNAGSGVQPTSDFRQIIFTSISLFHHLENGGNKICSPLTSLQCFSDKRLNYAEQHVSATGVGEWGEHRCEWLTSANSFIPSLIQVWDHRLLQLEALEAHSITSPMQESHPKSPWVFCCTNTSNDGYILTSQGMFFPLLKKKKKKLSMEEVILPLNWRSSLSSFLLLFLFYSLKKSSFQHATFGDPLAM